MASGQGLGALRQSRVTRTPRGGWAWPGIFVALLALGLFAPGAQADVSFEWAAAMGSVYSSSGRDIAVDSEGNVYSTGIFYGTVDFDPGPGVFYLTGASYEIFVQKLDSNGHFVWARSMGGSDIDQGLALTVDGLGNVYTTGAYRGIADFDPGPGTFNLSSAGSNDIFVQKLNAEGNFVWARAMGGTGSDWGHGIAVDSAGNVYTTGRFQGTVDFDPGPGTFNRSGTIFVQKLDTDGDFVWARAMGGSSWDDGSSIAVSGAGNVYTTGFFSGTADFDPGSGSFYLSSAGDTDTYVQKLDADGDFVWARAMGGAGSDWGRDIAVDGAGNVYTTGSFSATVDFDSGQGAFNLSSAGDRDIFVQKLNTDGDFVWTRAMGGTGDDQGESIAVDDAGNVYTTGQFQNTVNFDPGTGAFNLSSAGDRDIFVQKLNTDGDFVWTRAMGGTGWDEGRGIAVDDVANIYATGWFSGMADFDPGPSTFNLTSAGGRDIFNLKWSALPHAMKITPTSNGPTNASSVGFTVAFNEAVVNFEDASDLVISHTGTASTGVSITGGPEVYTVTVEGISGDGSFTLAVNTASDVEDLDGNPLASSVTSVPVFIDNTPPNAVSTTSTSTGPSNAGSVDFTVVFDEPVQGFEDVADLVIAHSGTANTGVSIAGGPEVYTVTVEGITGNGAFTLAVNTASDVTDLAGNALATSVTSAAVLIDTAAPKAVLLSPTTTGPTNAESVEFTVAFDEPVQAFNDLDDLVIDHSGTTHAGATITGGPAVYGVIIEGLSGTGAFTLTVNTASDVLDLAGNPLMLSVTSAPVLLDDTAPHAVTITPATTGPTNASTIAFSVAFNKAVEGFDATADLVMDHTGTAHTGASIAGGPESYSVSIDGISGDGSFTLAVNNASGVVDLVGNPLASSVTSVPVVIDNTPPTIAALTVSPSALEPGDVALIQFDVSEMLLGDPLVQVAGTPAAVAPLEGVKSLGHSYHWTSPADAPVGRITGRTLVPGVGYFNPVPWPYGPRDIEITLTDLAGNTITHTVPEGLTLVSGLPVAWPGLAVLALLFAAGFAFRTRCEIRSE